MGKHKKDHNEAKELAVMVLKLELLKAIIELLRSLIELIE